MPHNEYRDLYEITELQTNIMHFIAGWVKSENTPVPHRAIVEAMTLRGTKDFTTLNAIQSLIKKGYIRKAIVISNKRYYVQLKSIK